MSTDRTRIQLTAGYCAIVDPEDFDALSAVMWRAAIKKNGVYARRGVWIDGRVKTVYMHREIVGARAGEQVDHVNRDTLDNRRSNLRRCSNRENARNRVGAIAGTSQFKGVYHLRGRWIASIRVMTPEQVSGRGMRVHLGTFATEDAAARAYDEAAARHYGEFARTNTARSA